jgi:hypothetical protein
MKNLTIRLFVFMQLSEFYVTANRRPKNVDMHTCYMDVQNSMFCHWERASQIQVQQLRKGEILLS